jgi:Sulfatase
VLSSFAIAQPLFDLLGRNGEFFAARGSTRWDVVVFGLAVLLVPPALLLGIEALTPRCARSVVHACFVAGLVGLFVLQAIHGLGGPGWLLAVLAGAAGVGAAALYMSASAARFTLTVLAPAPLLFLGVFLFHSDASRLTLGATDAAYAAGEQSRTPAVLVVFDELPLNSLLDSHGRIDAARFPNFARLARGSSWFANASTVAEGTTHAVPAILTGRYPRAGELPVYGDHRQNIFTLLGGATRLRVADEETHLCPPKLCPGLEGSFGSRMESLAEDTGVVYLRELLPASLASGIPSIANGWGNFLRDESAHHDPGRLPAAWVDSLRPSREPELWYVHVMLPHSPWQYLPSGRRYSVRSAPGWGSDEVWTDNQAAVDQYWQRHLLQLGYADRVLGGVVARLRASGLYDRALLVVTADHGVSFQAGQKRRPLSGVNLQDIAYVPLFVKLPGQHRGRVVRAPARTVDILPTIARVLGVRVPWSLDGRPLLPSPSGERDVVLIKDHGRRFVIPAGKLEAERKQALRRQLALFGSDEPFATLYAVGRYRSLLGKRLSAVRVQPGGAAQLDALDRSTDPVQVSGQVAPSVHDVAVAAGGRIVAVAPASKGRFWALVPRRPLERATPQLYSIEGPQVLRRLS